MKYAIVGRKGAWRLLQGNGAQRRLVGRYPSARRAKLSMKWFMRRDRLFMA